MNNQKLLIYDFDILYQILDEIKIEINFKIINIKKNDPLLFAEYVDEDSLIITREKIINVKNQLIINSFPIKILQLFEKINLCLLKHKFNEQSEFNVGKYKINLNSREMIFGNSKLKLTEKEINVIIFLSKLNAPANIQQLQAKVWEYNPQLETHTVETHVYRLRKKISEAFNDENFIISKKDGYQII